MLVGSVGGGLAERGLSQRCGLQDPLLDRSSLNHVLIENDRNPFRCDTSIPDAIRPDQQDWALIADSQAISLAAQDDSLFPSGIFEVKLADLSLESVPACSPDQGVTTLGFDRCGAEQQVMADQLIHAASDGPSIRLVPRFTCSRTV